MPYTADATNTATPADGDYIVNGPAEVRAIKVALAAVVATTTTLVTTLQDLYVTTNTTLTTAQSGLTVLLSSGLLTLPACINSTRFRIVGTNAGSGSFQTPSGLIYYPDNNTIAANTPTSVPLGASFDLIADGTNWIITSMTGNVIVQSSTIGNRPARIDQTAGIGQSWQNMTGVGGRALGVTIYNTATKSIDVSITTQGGLIDTYNDIQLTIGTETYSGSTGTSRGSATRSTVYGTVPPGAGYQINSNYPILRWSECS